MASTIFVGHMGYAIININSFGFALEDEYASCETIATSVTKPGVPSLIVLSPFS